MPKRKISRVWTWFSKSSDRKIAKCIKCGEEYKTSGNTSNLFDHIKRAHMELLNSESIEEEISDTSSVASSSSCSSKKVSQYFD